MKALPLTAHPVISWTQIVPIGKDEKAFFVQLGARVAALRKDQGITQVQMAALLNVSQQTITAYEAGRRRMPVSSLPVIARYLGVSIEELIGEPPSAASKKRGPTPKIQQQMERIQQLPKAQQRFVMQMIDTVLAQQGR
jgi:transcriptional regulator with XRE-family HTH domain